VVYEKFSCPLHGRIPELCPSAGRERLSADGDEYKIEGELRREVRRRE
jgi:hypothetical protein